MKFLSALSILLSFLNVFTVQGQSAFSWVRQLGGSEYDSGYAISTDAQGNVYTTGYFSDTIDFDPGPETFNLISAGGWDIFVTKHTPNGNLVWARRMGGTIDDLGRSIKTDTAGNVYISGEFQLTADFDPGAGIYNLTSVGNTDFFISKLDANGIFVWVKQIGGISNDGGYTTVDDLGNVYIFGALDSILDVDPGANVYNLTTAGWSDLYICKLNSNGSFLWAGQIGGISSDGGRAITLDASNNILITGKFGATVDFDPGAGIYNLTSLGAWDIFVEKLDANGNFMWAKQMMNNTPDYEESNSIACDAFGNVFTTGTFSDSMDCDPGPGTYYLITQPANRDIFVNKLDLNGNFVWAKQLGQPTGAGRANSIAVDALGDVYTTGELNGIGDFDPGPAVYNLSAAPTNQSIFLSKLDANGNFVWAHQMNGLSDEAGYSIAVDLTGNVYSTGYFHYTVDFDPGIGLCDLTAVTSYRDVYIHKMSQGPLGIKSIDNISSFSVYPNPMQQYAIISFLNPEKEPCKIVLYNTDGDNVRTYDVIKSNKLRIEKNNLTAGIYFFQIENKNIIIGRGKIIIQ